MAAQSLTVQGCLASVASCYTRGMFYVSEVVRFCYGHRLLDYVGKCARVHGHNGKVEIVLAAPTLDKTGFVVDFHDVEAAALKFIDETLDHRLLLRRDDPLIPALEAANEPFVALDVNPSAEHLAKLIYDHLASSGLPVFEVRFFETETSVAVYRGAPPASPAAP
jgi:6-pyruvoyltetrahydropterin/6-carboxytetrahydropterin synthase